jgi:hypothetical protein
MAANPPEEDYVPRGSPGSIPKSDRFLQPLGALRRPRLEGRRELAPALSLDSTRLVQGDSLKR